jgi:Cu(I)/Ag(I) efflux system membrane fusion protein
VPASAVLRTGRRAVVYVEVPDQEQPTYEGRVIELGPKAGGTYIVASGLEAGESVVTSGAFKIDSALQIQAKPSMMSMPSEPEGETQADPSLWLPLIEPYLALHKALAGDDRPGAREALQSMMAITGHHGEPADLIHEMLAADSLDALRRPHFEALSNHLIRAAEADPEALPHTLYRMHCPMVYNDRGADWLQANESLLNPYFGASMLRCGDVEATITKER